jgi:hypothetical protein
MENINDILNIEKPVNTEKPTLQNPSTGFSIIDYTLYRDIFWKKRYSVSYVLYICSSIIGWLVIIISFLSILALLFGTGLLKELGVFMLLPIFFAGIMLLFLSEIILFQIDKNFFSYMEIHKKLENLKES